MNLPPQGKYMQQHHRTAKATGQPDTNKNAHNQSCGHHQPLKTAGN
jgi:hypothetical protein